MNRLDEELHHPDCCCQYNPTTYNELKNNVLASECCPVHNYNPIECQACTKCKAEENEKLV